MDAREYRRRLAKALLILIAVLIAYPVSILGTAFLACSTSHAGGCADAGMLAMVFGLPVIFASLFYIAWIASRRWRALGLSPLYAVMTLLLLAGCLQSFMGLAYATVSIHRGLWRLLLTDMAPLLLTILILSALAVIPEVGERGREPPALRIAFTIVAVILLARFADSLLFPLNIVPGIMRLRFAIRGWSEAGPLHFVSPIVLVIAFAALFGLLVRAWRAAR